MDKSTIRTPHSGSSPELGEVAITTDSCLLVLTIGASLRFAIVSALAYIASRAVRSAVRWSAAGAIVVIAIWWCVVVFANAVTAAHLF